MLACTHKSHSRDINKITFSRDHRVLKNKTKKTKTLLLLLNGLYILTGLLSFCTKPQVKINITALLKLEEPGGPTALKEKGALHIPHRAAANPLPPRRVHTTCTKTFLFGERWASFTRGCQFSNVDLQHWLISIRLQVKPFFFSPVVHENQTRLACVVSAESWASWVFERTKLKTPSRLVNFRT